MKCECKVYWGNEGSQREINWFIANARCGRWEIGDKASGWVEVYPQGYTLDDVYKTRDFNLEVVDEGVQIEVFGSKAVITWDEIDNDYLFVEHFVEKAFNIFMF